VDSLLQRSTELLPSDGAGAGAGAGTGGMDATLVMAEAMATQAAAMASMCSKRPQGPEPIAVASTADKACVRSAITLAGFLMFLDADGADGMVVVMTTNRLDNLDVAVWRAVRVDVCVYMPPCSPGQVRTLYKKFYETDRELTDGELPDLSQEPAIVSADVETVFREHKFDSEAGAAALCSLKPRSLATQQ
jgi:SpoVK/Ycf46/Vps4 family AAA+-type ATPase